MQGSYRVYISSTFEDLTELREVAAKAVRSINLQTYAMQEDCTSTEQRSVDKCREDVKECHFYIGIIAFRYGYIPKGYKKSITHLEYDAAGEKSIPRLLFLIDDAVPWPRSMMDKDSTKIDEFRDLIKKQHTITIIKDVNELDYKITAALSNQIKQREGTQSRLIPDIVPYLSNRSIQEQELEALLCDCETTLHQKPLVGIIHGDEHECHDKFIEKLQGYLLPDLLNLPEHQNSIKDIPIRWPAPGLQVQPRFKILKNKLSHSLMGKNYEKDDTIVQALNMFLSPVLIYTTIQAGEWHRDEPQVIERWIDYWNRMPDLVVGKKLTIFLCFKYKNIQNMNFFEARKYNRLNQNLRQYIENLNLAKFKNINGLALTELSSITYEELDEWITKYAAVYCDAEALRYEIDQHYKQQKMNAICMYLLATKLRECLKMHLKPGV